MSLFESGNFTLHSGEETDWRINAEVLSSASLEAIALWAWLHLPKFRIVEGVPSGGIRLAEALDLHVDNKGALLIVDDVLTTGASMEKRRAGRDAIGFVIFARGPCPSWVTAMWRLGE